MPKDYENVRDSCIDKKEKQQGKPCSKKQVQSCKKMAAIWYYKKHGKPVPRDKETSAEIRSISYEVNSSDAEVIRILDFIKRDLSDVKGYNFLHEDNKFVLTIKAEASNTDESVRFAQPFSKMQANYRDSGLSEMIDPNIPILFCGKCCHFVWADKTDDICHLVRGFIDYENVCDFYSDKLMDCVEEEVEDEEVEIDTEPKDMME